MQLFYTSRQRFIHLFITCDLCRRYQLQVAAYKGDMKHGVIGSIFPLTYIEKPIIINSFHKGPSGWILPRIGFALAGESPGLFLESKQVAGYKLANQKSLFHKRVIFSWLSDAEIPTGVSLSLSGRLLPQSPNSNRLCTSISSPLTNICGPHGCANGPAGTRIPNTSPSPCWKPGVSKSNPPCNRTEPDLLREVLLEGSPQAALSCFTLHFEE